MATGYANGQILQITAWCRQESQASLNIGKFLVAVDAGTPTVEGMANTIATAWADVYKAVMPNLASFDGLIFRLRSPVESLDILSTIAPVAGTVGANPTPAQVSAIVTLRTARPGRAYRGRKYVGFLDESLTTTAFSLNAAGLAAVGAVGNLWGNANAYVNGGDGITLQPVIAHRTPVWTTENIVGALTRPYLVTQKRRGALGRQNVTPFA